MGLQNVEVSLRNCGPKKFACGNSPSRLPYNLSLFLFSYLSPSPSLPPLIDVPGGYKKEVESIVPHIISAIWLPEVGWEPKCSGWYLHWLCIVSSGDLHRLRKFMNTSADPHTDGAMFHNKYFMERDHTVMDCIEEELVSRNKLEYEKDCIT